MSSRDTYGDILNGNRPALHHKPMDTCRRAKQFAPFAALKGLEECIHKQENIYTEKKELSEDRISELNFRLRMLTYGMQITVVHFVADTPDERKGHYEISRGKVCGYDSTSGLLLDHKLILPENLYDLAGDGPEDQAKCPAATGKGPKALLRSGPLPGV